MKSDSQLKTDVSEELKWEPSVNALQIGVEVKDGIVTLAGHVDSYAEKWNAERAAQRVSGVKALAVEMDVRLLDASQRNDADIARSAEQAILWTSYLPKDSIEIMVEKGWITLTGEVDWEYQRSVAAGAMRHLMGVTGVSNQIVLKAIATSNGVKAAIESALQRRAASDTRHIKVAVSGSEVTLSGDVQSWSERELAKSSAWGAPGVRSVVDNLSVNY
jgi:osmotically-inducible protein OsmY